MKMLPLLFLCILHSAILCADPPKPKPEGKEQPIPIHPFSLKAECGYVISFKRIFTKPGIYGALFGGVGEGYAHSIGLLGLLSLSRVPVKKLFAVLSEAKVGPYLNHPALNQAKVWDPYNPLIATFKKHFGEPENVTIRDCLSKKSLFKWVLKEYNSDVEPYLSRPFSKILSIAKLNTLSPPPSNKAEVTSGNQNSSNSSSSQNNEPCLEEDIEASADQEGELKSDEDEDSEFEIANFLWILNDPRFLPFLLKLKTICATDISTEVFLTSFSSNNSLAIESHPEKVDSDFALGSPLMILYHWCPDAYNAFMDAYGVSDIPQLIALFRAGWDDTPDETITRFLDEFDDKAPLVLLPYRHPSTKHDILSTGSTLCVTEHEGDSVIKLNILDGNLIIDKEWCSCYHVIRILSNGEWEYIAESVPFQEAAMPGTLYAIILKSFSTFNLKQLLLSLNNIIELMADALEDYGFSVFQILPSLRENE